MPVFIFFLSLLLFLSACQNNPSPLRPLSVSASDTHTAAVGLNIYWPVSQNFDIKAIPSQAEELQIEIVENLTYLSLYRTTVLRSEVQQDRVNKQIRIDLQGSRQKDVIISVMVRDRLKAVIASARQALTLKGGEINRVRLKVEVHQNQVVIIGGGGGFGGFGGFGGSGGSGGSGGGAPIPTPTPTAPPMTYTLTPQFNTFYVDVNQPFSLSFKVWNGSEPVYIWQFSGTQGLPEGLAFTSASGGNIVGNPPPLLGLLSIPSDTVTLQGTTSQTGTFPFTITVSNGTQTTSRTYNLVVRNLEIFPGTLKPATAGVSYDQAFQALYGAPPYTWSHSGNLPPGLSLNTNNTDTIRLTGTPTAAINADTYTFTIRVTDSLNRSAEQTYVLGCGDGALAAFRNVQPVVNSVSPPAGGNNADQIITISGSNFQADAKVFLDKISLSIQSQSSTQIIARVPAGIKPGTYNLLVINPNSSIGRVEGGLANGYTVEDRGGLVSNPPVIGGLFLRSQPILPTTSQEELAAQLLTITTAAGTQMIPGKALNQNSLDFVPILISGANFSPDSLVYLSELILPGFYVDSTQILTIVPLKLLFPDIPGVPQFTGYNKLMVVNPNLENSNPEQGKFAVSGSFDVAEGPGVGYISYVYPQKGFDSENNRVVVKGCGFERPHVLRLANTAITQKVVELPSVIRMEIEAGQVYPNPQPYDLRLFRVENLVPVLSDNASGVFTMLARERKVNSCSPHAILPNLTMAITLNGTGFEAGISTKFIRHNAGGATGTAYDSPVTIPQTSLKAKVLVPGGLPQGEYKVQMTWPGGFIYTTPDTCLRIETQAAQPAPVITSVSPTSVSNNILNPEERVDIVIEGNYFQQGAAIYIGAKQAISGTGSTTRLTINSDTVYAMPPGTYPIRVVNPDGQSVTASVQLTVTDGRAELAPAPEIIQVVPSNPYRSMLNPYPDAGYVYFQASNILPGSYVQVVTDPSAPFDPQDAFLDGIVILNPDSGSVRGTLPFLRAGTYYLRLINADGQMDTSDTPIIFENSPPPKIETDPTQLAGAPECKQPICPASWPNNLPVVLTINGKNLGVAPYYSGVQLVSTTDPNSVITLQNVTSYNTGIPMVIAGLPDGLAPGEYWVRIVNPDGQTSDAVNRADYYDPNTGQTRDTRVKFTILDSSTRWSRAQRMPNLVDPGSFRALHGRAGASAVVDPDTGKIYFFGGNDARQNYNHLTRTLITYSETSGWQDLSQNVPLTLNVRVNHAAAWKNGSNPSEDRLFVFGGITWSCPGEPPTACPNPISPSLLDDLWMYTPSTNSWTALTINGSGRIPLSNAKMHWNPADHALYLYGGVTTPGNGVLGTQYNNKIFKLAINFSNNTATWSTVTPVNQGPTSSAADCSTADASRPCAWLYNDMLSDPERGRFFIFGGAKIFNGIPLNDKIWMFDIAHNKWAEIPQFGTGFIGRAGFAHGFDFNSQTLYVFGGYTNLNSATTSLIDQMNIGIFSNWSGDADNPPIITWSAELATPLSPRYSHACAWSNGRFYVFGGLNQDGVLLYDPNSPRDPLESGHTYYTDFWQYIP